MPFSFSAEVRLVGHGMIHFFQSLLRSRLKSPLQHFKYSPRSIPDFFQRKSSFDAVKQAICSGEWQILSSSERTKWNASLNTIPSRAPPYRRSADFPNSPTSVWGSPAVVTPEHATNITYQSPRHNAHPDPDPYPEAHTNPEPDPVP